MKTSVRPPRPAITTPATRNKPESSMQATEAEATAKPAAAFQKIHRQAAKETRRVKHQATNSSRT